MNDMPKTISHAWQRSRRQVVHTGDSIVVGRYGLVRFRQHVILDDGREYIDVVSPEYGFRSVRPEQVRSIPRTRKVRDAKPERRTIVVESVAS